MAAPISAAAAVTASNAVLKFTLRLLATRRMQGMCRHVDRADDTSGRLLSPR
jgi:hypothetical protein